MSHVLPLIRFPCMAIEDIANYVSLSGVLNALELVQIFTYLGSDDSARTTLAGSPGFPFPTRQRIAQANLKWTLDPKVKSSSVSISAGNLKANSSSSAHAYFLGNTLFLAGKYVWQVSRTSGDSNWLFLGVSGKKQFADNSMNDKAVWGVSSGGQLVSAGVVTPGTNTNLGKGPLHCMLDCDNGTFTVLNLSTNTKTEIKGLPKKDDIAKVEGGGLVPHICMQNQQEVVVLPLHIGKFGKKVTQPV